MVVDGFSQGLAVGGGITSTAIWEMIFTRDWNWNWCSGVVRVAMVVVQLVGSRGI